MTKKKAIIFVISDFFFLFYEKPFKIISQKHEVIPIIITDPWEKNIDFKGHMFLEDSETGDFLLINGKEKDLIKKNLMDIKIKRDKMFKEMGIDYLELYTDRSYLKDLFMFFQRRFQRR